MAGIFGGGGGDPGKATAKVDKQIYGENKALLSPFVTPALGAQSAYAELLGLTNPGSAGTSTPNTGGSSGGSDSLNQLFNGGAPAPGTSTPAGSTPSAGTAFQNYLNSTGHQFRLDQGSKAITGNQAVSGMLNSGATLKGLQQFGQNIGTEDFTNYMNMLGNLTASGLGAAGSLAGAGNAYAGQVANTNAMSSNYKAQQASNTMGTITSLIPLLAGLSDRRLKTNIVKVAAFHDGLNLYEFSYVGGGPVYKGVMADEVAVLRPWALGTTIGGYATVNYGAL